MEIKNNTLDKILSRLIKEPFVDHSATSLAKSLGITRQGLWKTLNKLSKDNLISLKSIANTKKSTLNIKLNYKNLITEKVISLLLTKESLNYERWRFNFTEISDYSKFIILFGSILHSPKEANDIDLLLVVDDKKDFNTINKIMWKLQQTQVKKIHFIALTEKELKEEFQINKNKAYIDAFKKGIVLFGQEDYVKFVAGLNKE
ncbi:MAG: nucleotidyltransferase domain-containing protein [Nanoarchaeota archaeon]